MKKCPHYTTETDIVSVRFKCCGRHYPCYQCHEEVEKHLIRRWEVSELGVKAILCRKCSGKLTICEYMACSFRCIHCGSQFNPGCRDHWNIYFKSAF